MEKIKAWVKENPKVASAAALVIVILIVVATSAQ